MVFIFPDEPFADCYLWADSAHLSKLSPVWQEMFSKDWKESQTPLARLRSEHDESFEEYLARIIRKGMGDDSGYIDLMGSMPVRIHDSMLLDDEAGSLLEFIPGRSAEMSRRAHVVVVRDTSMLAYNSVLTWTLTHKLIAGSGPSQEACQLTPSLLKRIYELADLLLIDELKETVLPQYNKFLTATNAMAQLLSPACLAYKGLRDLARAAVLLHWNSIPDAAEQLMRAMTSPDLNQEHLAEAIGD